MSEELFSEKERVRQVLQRFQDGYTQRDLSRVDEFMQLFSSDAGVEVIGTNGIQPGVDEWYKGREAARALVHGDWEGWGDVRLDIEKAHIEVLGPVSWLAATGTVTMKIEAEQNYKDFLQHIRRMVDAADLSPEQKLLTILRDGTNTVFELRRGENFVWPLRFTSVLVQEEGEWRFHQMVFSLPTIYFPDVRYI